MQKPNGYDDAKTLGEFTPVELGGHYAVVKQVTERQSSTGKDMIVVLFDFCAPDKQKEYFANQFNNSDKEEKKWPYAGSKYIMVYDYNDSNKTSRTFKTFCTCIEKSNNYKIAWNGSNWAQQFKGKKVGVVFGEEESEYNGEVRMRNVPKWFCVFDKVPDQSVPRPKYINGVGPATTPQKDDSFINVSDSVEEEIPF